MNSTPPQSSASLPEADSASATTDPARTALLDALNELLEAERAGARVAMETGRSITDPELAALVEDIHKDEVRWCSMLMRTIKSLGGHALQRDRCVPWQGDGHRRSGRAIEVSEPRPSLGDPQAPGPDSAGRRRTGTRRLDGHAAGPSPEHQPGGGPIHSARHFGAPDGTAGRSVTRAHRAGCADRVHPDALPRGPSSAASRVDSALRPRSRQCTRTTPRRREA
jgi:hypothetical protein